MYAGEHIATPFELDYANENWKPTGISAGSVIASSSISMFATGAGCFGPIWSCLGMQKTGRRPRLVIFQAGWEVYTATLWLAYIARYLKRSRIAESDATFQDGGRMAGLIWRDMRILPHVHHAIHIAKLPRMSVSVWYRSTCAVWTYCSVDTPTGMGVDSSYDARRYMNCGWPSIVGCRYSWRMPRLYIPKLDPVY